MIPYLGDFSEDATVYIPFNTFDSNDPAASVTITNLADADIKVHKDGSVTQIVTDGATIAIDFDGITGNHLITVDTSAHADYATGSDYIVRIEGTTVDAATINAWVGQFSIENRHSAGALRPTVAGRTLDVTATGAAGIDWGNVENPTTAVDLSGTDIQLCDTVTTLTGHTAQTGDNYARLGAPAGASLSADVAAVKVDSAAILLDTAEIGIAGAGLTNINLPNQTMDITGNLSGSVGSVTGAVGSVTGSVGSVVGHTPQTGDSFARIGVAGAGLTGIGTIATVTNLTNLPTIPANWLTAAGIDANALDDKGNWLQPTTAGRTLDVNSIGHAATMLTAQSTTISGLTTQTSFQLTEGASEDDVYNGFFCRIEDQATSTQVSGALVSDYDGATKTVTLAGAPSFTIVDGDYIEISPMANGVSQSSAAAAVSAMAAAIGVLTDSASTGDPDTSTTLQSYIKQLVNVLVGTAGVTTFPAAAVPGNAVSLAEVLRSIYDQLGTAGAGLTAVPWNPSWDAEVESEVNDALDTAIAELGVAAPTATPTLRTGLMLLYMALRNQTKTQTSGTDALEIYNDAGTKIASKALTDDSSDYTEAKMISG